MQCVHFTLRVHASTAPFDVMKGSCMRVESQNNVQQNSGGGGCCFSHEPCEIHTANPRLTQSVKRFALLLPPDARHITPSLCAWQVLGDVVSAWLSGTSCSSWRPGIWSSSTTCTATASPWSCGSSWHPGLRVRTGKMLCSLVSTKRSVLHDRVLTGIWCQITQPRCLGSKAV